MKNSLKIIVISFNLIIPLIFYSCNPTSLEETTSIPYEEILMKGMDIVSMGGTFEASINSQREYDELIYQRFQKPLDDYWNVNYESILLSVKENNPGLTDKEYENLVKEIFYSVYPFRGTENYSHPNIDFSKFTLLGQSAHSIGCETPVYNIEVEKNRNEYTYRISIRPKGNCSLAISKNKWILIPKILMDCTVKFETITIYSH